MHYCKSVQMRKQKTSICFFLNYAHLSVLLNKRNTGYSFTHFFIFFISYIHSIFFLHNFHHSILLSRHRKEHSLRCWQVLLSTSWYSEVSVHQTNSQTGLLSEDHKLHARHVYNLKLIYYIIKLVNVQFTFFSFSDQTKDHKSF